MVQESNPNPLQLPLQTVRTVLPSGALAPVASMMPDSCVLLGRTHTAEEGSGARYVAPGRGEGS